jgi:hypothetical protein
MKVGELYRCTLTGNRTAFQDTRDRWHNKLCLYMGEDIIDRSDGVRIVNHKFLLNGNARLVDRTFLKYFSRVG